MLAYRLQILLSEVQLYLVYHRLPQALLLNIPSVRISANPLGAERVLPPGPYTPPAFFNSNRVLKKCST